MDVWRKGFRHQNLLAALSRRPIRYTSYIEAMHSSFERVPFVHEAHDVRAVDGGALRLAPCSVPHPILVRDEIRKLEMVALGPSVAADDPNKGLIQFSALMTN